MRLSVPVAISNSLSLVRRKLYEADPRFLRLGDLERLAQHLGNDLGLADLGRVLRDRLEELHQIHVLVALLVHARGLDLTRQRDHRCPIHVGICDTRHQVAGPRPEGRVTDTGAPNGP